jgi:hypothetical protein
LGKGEKKKNRNRKGRKKGGIKGKRAEVPTQTENAKKGKQKKEMKIMKFEEKIFQ